MRNNPEIHGLIIPGLTDKLVINLFAKNTTLYLSECDSFNIVEPKLRTWCNVSGAKFNIEKMEIIPLGTETHRNNIITMRKINPQDHTALDNRIHIAKDGEAVRSLGAWIGNHTTNITPWELTLDKIQKRIELWKRSNITLYSKQLIIQAIIRGLTQFLAMAQGMPEHIETAITQMTRDFIWDNDTALRMTLEHLEKPIEEGGLNILNIKACNKAIEIMWLKLYLEISLSHPAWAIVTDLIINAATPLGTSVIVRVNTFTQSWDPPTRGPCPELIGGNTMRMLKVTKKHGTNLATIQLSTEVRMKLPAWYHPFSEPHPMISTTAQCLLRRHKAITVADLVKSAKKLQNQRLN